jgi:predicted nucleotidyltransferase
MPLACFVAALLAWYNTSMATQKKTKVTTLEEIRAVIEQHRPELKSQFHVDKIGVFGSYARGDQKKRSDVDFLVTFDEAISLFDRVDLNIYLQELMGRRVDVIPHSNLRPELSEYVLKDLIYL